MWGAFTYDQSKDVLRVTAKPEKGEYREWLTFGVPELSADKATVVLRWENLVVPFTVDTGATAKVADAARSAVASAKADEWRTRIAAAAVALDNNMLEAAQAYSDQALKADEKLRQ